jgi:hypothetical protein
MAVARHIIIAYVTLLVSLANPFAPAAEKPAGADAKSSKAATKAAAKSSADEETEEQPNDAETVTFRQNSRQLTVKGRPIVEAADGGILFQGVDGVLWSIERNELERRERLDAPFKPLNATELAEQMLAESPAGFRTFTTTHYVVCYNTSRAYAQWTSCSPIAKRTTWRAAMTSPAAPATSSASTACDRTA